MEFNLLGKTVAATHLLNDSYFENALILIVEQHEEGTIGLIQNRLFGRDLNELEEFSYSKSLPLLEGGPCEQDSLYFIHNHPDLKPQTEKINDSWYWKGDFKKAIHLYNQDNIDKSSFKIFIGYSGWDRGELEAEIAEGSWILL